MTSPTYNPNLGRGLVGTGRAHGKVILMGEHAVVYGAPAIAVPVPQLAVTATAEQFPVRGTGTDEVTFTITESVPEPVVMQATDGLQRMVAEFKETTGVDGRLRINVLLDCAIPGGRGLGSSAACARAVILAFADLFDRRLDAGTVFNLVQTAENVAHGRASGIDAVATGSPHPILFSNGTVQELRFNFDGVFVVADSGVAGRTRDAVELLRQRFERDPHARGEFVDRVSGLTRAAVLDVSDGRPGDFGARMTAGHKVLARAGLSTDRIDTMVDSALAAGALGAKISGGGLGGCMIALVDEPDRAEAVATRLHEAGAVRAWTVPVGRSASHDR